MIHQLATRTKLLVFFFVAVAVTAATSLLGYRGIRQVDDRLQEVADVKFAALAALDRIENAHQLAMRAANALQIERAAQDVRDRSYARISKALDELVQSRRTYEAVAGAEAASDEYRRFAAAYDGWRSELDQLIALARAVDAKVAAGEPADAVQGARAQASARWASTARAEREMTPAIEALAARNASGVEQAKSEAAAAARRSARLQLATLVAGALLLFGFGVVLDRDFRRISASLSAEAGKVRDAVTHGRLDVRADPSRVHLEFRGAAEVLNGTMDAFMVPLGETAAVLERIAHGDLPPPASTRYEGDFDRMRRNLDTCVDAVRAVVAEADSLTAAAVAGDLAVRGDPARHEGEFRRIVSGMNATLDAMLGPIGEATGVLEALARRDLGARMQGSYRGGHARMRSPRPPRRSRPRRTPSPTERRSRPRRCSRPRASSSRSPRSRGRRPISRWRRAASRSRRRARPSRARRRCRR
jgi:methyl-accepting chemotaxis protein